MKKLSILFLLLTFLLTGCSEQKEPDDLLKTIKKRGKLIVGIKTDSKPFGFYQNEEIKGFDVDISQQIASDIFNTNAKDNIEFVSLTPYERISALNSGKVDILVATLSINEKRKEIIDFSIPYFVAGQALMVPINSNVRSINNLNGKRAAVVLGTTGEKTLRMLAPNATSMGAMNYKDAFNMLKENKVEAILADDSLLYGILIDNKGYRILPSRFTEEYYAVGIRKGPENENLKKLVNSSINSIDKNGKLNKIKAEWIPKTGYIK